MKNLLTVVAVVTLSGCGLFNSFTPETPEETIGLTASTFEAIANETKLVCGNVEPGGPCLPDSLITTADRDWIQARLFEGLDALETAQDFLDVDNAVESREARDRARALLIEIRRRYSSVGITGEPE